MNYLVNIIYELDTCKKCNILCDSYSFTNIEKVKDFLAKKFTISVMLSAAEKSLTFEEFIEYKKTIIIKEVTNFNVDSEFNLYEDKCFYPNDKVKKLYDFVHNNLSPHRVSDLNV